MDEVTVRIQRSDLMLAITALVEYSKVVGGLVTFGEDVMWDLDIEGSDEGEPISMAPVAQFSDRLDASANRLIVVLRSELERLKEESEAEEQRPATSAFRAMTDDEYEGWLDTGVLPDLDELVDEDSGGESPSASSPPSTPPTPPPEGPPLTVDLERGGEMSDVEYRELRRSTGGRGSEGEE